ncbi:nesprin-2 isoform X5 [Dendrobates tinctorius]
MTLITTWLEEQQRIALSNVPVEILSKWKLVLESLIRDGSFLIERTYEKTATKISQRLKTLNHRWSRYVMQHEEEKVRKVRNGSTAQEHLADDSEEVCETQSDISDLSFSLYIQSLQKSGKDTKTLETASEILSHFEAVEKVMEAADNWSEKAEQLFSDLDQQETTREPFCLDIQDFYHDGISCQERLEKTEANVQALAQLLHHQEYLQSADFDKWRHKVVRTQERIQDLVSRVSWVVNPPEQSLSKEDIKRNFESSRSKLETYITEALSLLGQKVTPEEFISQYETSLSKFGNPNLERFLKTTELMKNISSSTKEKTLVEKVSADVRDRWKTVHDDLETYVSELKFHVEKKKFDKLICKLDKQIIKEKVNAGVGDTEELIREHEVVFSDHGCLGQLNRCLKAMQSLDDGLRTSAAPTTFSALVAECTKKKEDLDKNAADIYHYLHSVLEKNKIDPRNVTSAENGVKSNPSKTNGSPEVCEMDSMPQGTSIANDNESSGLTLELLEQRYNTEKRDLEVFIQSSRDKLVAESPKGVQDMNDLQRKLHELQVLLGKADRSWKEFDATSQKLEMFLHGTEKKKTSENRYALQYSFSIISEEIKSRIQSLSITINVLLPIEEDVSLCESSGQTPIHGVEHLTISNIVSVNQNLQDVQSSVQDQIQHYHNLEFAAEVVDPSHPVDVETVQSVVLQYKSQLEASRDVMKEREDLRKELDIFLTSLMTTKLAIQAEATVLGNDRTALLLKLKNLEELQQKVYKLRQEAEELDGRLEPVDIFLQDLERGGRTSCRRMLDGFFEEIQIVEQSILLRLRNSESETAVGGHSLNGTVHGSPQTEMVEFTVSKLDTVLQEIKDVQSSVQEQIQQCHNLESAAEVVDPSHPVDVVTVQSFVLQYKSQLEATQDVMKERENLLKELETFLTSITTMKLAIQAEAAMPGNDRTALLLKLKNLEELQQKVYKLRQEAEELDGRLEPVDIFLEDPERGGRTSCRRMLDGFFEKIQIVEQSILLKLRSLESETAIGAHSLNRTVHGSPQTEMMQFTVSKLDTVLQEIKDVQNTCEIEIEHLDSLDASFIEPISKHKTELQAINESMKEREKTLDSLGGFLSSLNIAKMSIEAEFPGSGMDRTILQEKQRRLESLEKDIYLLGQEAEKLDDCMQAAEILLEDPENGGETSCKKMISAFFEKLESAQQAVQVVLQSLQEAETRDHQNERLKDLCKNIQDIRDQIDKLGLKEPTIAAIQQRMKSLITLEKKLETLDQEKNSIFDAFQKVFKTPQTEDLTGCVDMWEDTQQYLSHSKEQCDAIIELLRKFQQHRTALTSLIQKVEMTICHRSFYIGKDNLHKMMMEVQELKQEIEDHSEYVEEINSICNKLQFQISKIKRCEDAPFQAETNTLIDKWLDVCEKRDGYDENLKRAVCLWNRVLLLSQEMEPWTEGKIKLLESSNLTSDHVRSLHIELQNQEKRLEEMSQKSIEIQKLLQSDELPFELQVINDSLVNKLTAISTSVSAVSAASDSPDSFTWAEELQEVTRNESESQAPTLAEISVTEVEPETAAKDTQESATATLVVGSKRPDAQEDAQVEPQAETEIEALRLRLAELQKRREKLSSDLQPRLSDNEKQLRSFRELLQESQDMMGILSTEISSAGTRHHGHWLEVKMLLETFTLDLQNTMQTLEGRLEGQRQYESLSTALNNKMTSFYEELLNFARSSRENAPCELKRQKLQVFRDQYEGLQSDLAQVAQQAEDVKQISCANGVTRIQEGMDMHRSKMRGFLERMDYLSQVIEEPPVIEKSKEKKINKGTKKKSKPHWSLETSPQTTMKAEEDNLVKATMSSVTQHTEQTTVQPAAGASVQHTEEPSVYTAHVVVQSPIESSEHFAKELVLQSSEKLSVQYALEPPETSAVHAYREETLVQSTLEILTQPIKRSSVQPTVEQSTLEHALQLTTKTSTQPTTEPLRLPAAETSELPDMELSLKTVRIMTEQTILKPALLPTIEPSKRFTAVSPVRSTEELPVRSTGELPVRCTGESPVRSTEESPVRSTEEPPVRSTEEPPVRSTEELPVRYTEEPPVRYTEEPPVRYTEEPPVRYTEEPPVRSTEEPPVRSTEEPPVRSTEEPPVRSTEEPPVRSTEEPPVRSTEEPPVRSTEEPPVRSTEDPEVRSTEDPEVRSTEDSEVRSTEVAPVGPVEETPVGSTEESPVVSTEEAPVLSIELPPTIEKRKEKKNKKGSKKSKHQQSLQTTMKCKEDYLVKPTMSVQSTEEAPVLSIELPPIIEERKDKKTKKAPKKKSRSLETLLQTTVKVEEDYLVKATMSSVTQNTEQTTVQPTAGTSLQHREETSVHTTHVAVQSPIEISEHFTKEVMLQSSEKSSVQSALEPPETSAMHAYRVEALVQPTLETLTQPTVQSAVEQSKLKHELQLRTETSTQPTTEPLKLPAAETSELPKMALSVQTVRIMTEQTILIPAMQPTIKPSVPLTVELSKQSTSVSPVRSREEPPVRSREEPPVRSREEPPVRSREEPPVRSREEPPVRSREEPPVRSREEPPVRSREEPPVLSIELPPIIKKRKDKKAKKEPKKKSRLVETLLQTVEPSVQQTVEPSVQPTAEPSAQPTEEPSAQPTEEPSAQPREEPSAQPREEPSAQPTVEPSAQPTVEPSAQPTEEPSAQPTEEPSAQPTEEPSAQPTEEPSAQPTVEPSAQPTEEPSAQPTVEPSAQPTVEKSAQPTEEPSVQPTEEPSVQSTEEPSVQPTKPSDKTTVEPSVQSIAKSFQYIIEPSKQTVELSMPSDAMPAVDTSYQSVVSFSVHLKQETFVQSEVSKIKHGTMDRSTHSTLPSTETSFVQPFSSVSSSLPPILEPSVPNTTDTCVLPTVDPIMQPSVRDSVEDADRNAVSHSVKSAIDSVRDLEAAQQPVLEISEQPMAQLWLQSTDTSKDQSTLKPTDTVNAMEKKTSKIKKKKKLNAGSAEKQKVERKSKESTSKQKSDTKSHSVKSAAGESIHQEHYVDVIDSSGDAAERKALQEAKAGQREASGQPQTLLQDGNSSRRPPETSGNGMAISDNDSLLITTVEKRDETLPDDGEKLIIINKFKDLELVEQTSAQVVPEPTPDGVQSEYERLLQDLHPHITAYQQEALEIFSQISHILGDELLQEKTLEKLGAKFKLMFVKEDTKMQPEKSPQEFYIDDLKKKIKKFSKEPIILNVMELDQEIEELEKICKDILEQHDSWIQLKTQDADVQSSERENLWTTLVALKNEKQKLLEESMTFQDALSAARRTYQMMTKEKENLKMSSAESLQSHLDKLKHFLDKLAKGKKSLMVLKTLQSKLGNCRIICKDKEEIDVDISQLEAFWEHLEDSVHREQDRLVKEAAELQFLQQKVDDLHSIIGVRQVLLDQPTPSPEDLVKASLLLSADVDTIKHLFSLLRNACDLQIKRSWGGNEPKTLESSLEKLQSSLESLEERVNDQQLTRCQTLDVMLDQYSFLKPLYDSHIWIKKSQNKMMFDQSIALLPEDVEQQIKTSKNLHQEILDRDSAVNSIIEESKHISQGIDPAAYKDMCSFFQQLQELYQEQIIQSVDRLQKLESGLEKRRALFSEIEKLKELLHCLEKEATPVKRGIFTAAELCEQLNCLKAKTTELEKIEGLVLTLLRNSQSYHRELKISEQLYLNDILRSLKSKARRIRTLEEKKFSQAEKLLRISNEFQERTTSLSQELSSLQPIEPKIGDEAEIQDGEDFEKKFQVSQNAVSSSQVLLSEILRYKDLFKDSGLYWDGLTVDNLRNKCLRFPLQKSGHYGHYEAVKERYEELLGEAKVMSFSVQRQASALRTHFDVIDAQVLCKKIMKIKILVAEALSLLHEKRDGRDVFHDEELTVRVLTESMARLHQSLSQLIAFSLTMEKSIQYRLEQTLGNLRKIHQDLMQPCAVNLDSYEIQEQLLKLEALDKICKSELKDARAISSEASPDELIGQFNEVEDIGKQVSNAITHHSTTIEKTFNIFQELQQTLTKLAELFKQHEETLLENPVDFNDGKDQVTILNLERERINIALAEIHNLANQLKSNCNGQDQEKLDDLENQISSKNAVLSEMFKRKQSELARYHEKHLLFKSHKQKIFRHLEEMEDVIGDSFSQKPTSYKAALAQWEKSKNLVAKVKSSEEDLLQLRQAGRDLSAVCCEDVSLFDRAVASLWDRWRHLLGVCRDWELYCDGLKQEWKLISELMELEVILLDNCQEEVLDRPEMNRKTAQLLSSVTEICRLEENMKTQKLQLTLLMRRLQNILGKPDVDVEMEMATAIMEINSMEDKCNKLLQKSQRNKQEIHKELEDREALKYNFSAVKQSLQQAASKLENMESGDPEAIRALLQEIQDLIESHKETAKLTMEKVSARYAEHVPAEVLSRAEECQEYLQEVEEKVKNEVSQSSPENALNRQLNEIKSGLQSIEVHLTEKSQNILQAKELQNKLWDDVDTCLSKLHALEEKVHEMGEEDPSQAQEWMDKLTEPFSYYQHITHLVERRTVNLKKAASKLEEYEDTLKSTLAWIQSTDTLLNEEMKDCSAKVLNKHVIALEIALDDSEQKNHLMDSIHSELGELALIFETESIVERSTDVRRKLIDLRQRILNVLPAIQHITHEVLAIEDEVKKMERTVNKIKEILTSNDIDDMTPKDHYMNGQVMLENINHIRKTIGEIEAYRPSLPLSESGVLSLCVFRRMVVVLREAEMLQNVIMEQNQLLEPIISEISELENEYEKAQQASREDSEIKEKAEAMKKQMERLNQKKEVILLAQRNSLIEHLDRLSQEPHDQDLESMLSPVTEGMSLIHMEVQRKDSYFLPSLAEETEDSTLIIEAADESTDVSVVEPEREEDVTNVPPSSEEQLKDAGKALADVQPKMILSDCQGKVTEVELWLQQVTLSPEESRQDPDMLRSLEEQLVECQKTLQETEMKINLLLEDADYRHHGNGAVLEEAENLALKLKALKNSLEYVQEMLQAKFTSEQIINGVKEENLPHTLTAKTAESADKTLVVTTGSPSKKHPFEITVPNQETSVPSQPRSSSGDGLNTPIKSQSKTSLSVIEDITWSKWLYLQKELSYRMKATSSRHAIEADAAKDVKIGFISRIPVSSVKSPLVEESKHFLTRLKAFNEEASCSVTPEGARHLHGALFVWMCSVSQWLQNIEEMLDLDILTREEAAAELTFYEKLTEDLHALSEEMGYNTSTLLSPVTHEGAHTSILSQCYSDLRDWLIQVHCTAKTRSKCMQGELDKHNDYQNDIRQLYDILLKKKTDLIQQLGTRGAGEAADPIQEAVAYENELLGFESQVSSLNERGEKLSIPICSNQDVHKLEDVLDDTWHIFRANQDKYSSAVINRSQVDALLCALSELLSLGKEKMAKSQEYNSRSIESLNAHVAHHRKFFNHLEGQVLLLQSLSSQKTNPDLDKEHIEMVTQDVETLRQQSDDHCINMMVILKNWKDFDSRYGCLSKKYEALETMIPTSSLVEESVERVTERLKQYQKIQKHIDENECGLSQALIAGKKLQSVVACPGLKGQINQMEHQWSQLSKKVNHELHRLESLISHLTSYNKDSFELSSWLESARQKLSSSRMQSLDASQKLDTIKNNLNNFFEFTNDIDQKSSLKTSVVNAGNQLLRLKESDTSVLKLSLAKFEESWIDLIGALPATQDKMQQQLVEKLPSLDAIRELMDWMTEDNEIRQLTSLEDIPSTAADIRNRLQRYKGLRREMSHKQCIVDYVNQSLLQLSVGDVESRRYERIELAELLGSLNLQWNQMLGNINAKIQHLEQALENISDQESRRQTVSNWFDAQQKRLEKLQRPLSITAAESVLAECMVLEEQLKAKSDGIEELDANKMAAGGQNVSNEGVLTTENLFRKRDQVARQVIELKTSTLSVLEHWKNCDENFRQMERMTIKLQYVLDQISAPSSSMDCLNRRLKRLQAIQEETELHEEKWSQLRASLGSLKSLCGLSDMADILEQEHRDVQSRWAALGEELTEHLQAAGSLLQVWKDYTGSCLELAPHIEQVEQKCEQLLYAKLSEDRVSDTLEQRIQDVKMLEQNLQGLRVHNLQVSELSDKVLRQNPAATDVIQSERQNTSHRIAHLERRASSKAAELKSIQNEVQSFKSDLDKLQSRIKTSADEVSLTCNTEKKMERAEVIKKHLLELSELTSDVERLNEEMATLPLGDRTQMSLQNLNRMWAKTIAAALEDCRQHRMVELEKNNFIQNYETWILCLEKMEDNLTVGIAGKFEALRKQQEIYERLQAEITINEHILPTFVNKALSVLELEDEQNSLLFLRNEFILKLTSLKEKWQSVIRLVLQKKKEISALLKQWGQFRVSKQSLEQLLRDVQEDVSSVRRQKCHSLINTQKLMYNFKDTERRLGRLQPGYITTVHHCKDVLSVADPESKLHLQRDLTHLQELWRSAAQQLQEALTHFSGISQKRHIFEKMIEHKRKTLRDLKGRVEDPLPTLHEELQITKGPLKELEEALDEWGDSLKDLDDMKSELSQYIIAEDGIVLDNQVEALHRQWEELCLRVSMRKQEIEDRLNAWNVFNEKNKELCDWLTQMESKVLQTGDVNIEEMIEKLQKDCMEEINLFSENKLHLKQIGDQLINASNQARSKEIENKLNKVNDRWKHLFDVIGSRVKKLKETLVTIQQLYKNMSNLRTWLARIESELSKPVIYSICDEQEINKKLEEQRDLQKDIEVHSPGVASVLNICERLLHDTDACANETECDSIQQTTRSLDKRWRNICSMSMERRMRIEETCRLWQKFLEDYSRFDEWLKEAEAMAASPDSSDVLYTKAKEEQKKFEAFQRQIHERLTHLELINKQYRRLARENRTDAASRLKQMVHEGNQRWDQLQKRVTSILRRLKHFTSQREDFEGTRDSILVWLTEMDLQLTNVEHFSESDIEEKMQQLIGFKQEITLNTDKIDQLIVFGEQLIQKSEAMDAVVIEDELEEIHRYCQEVFGRVYRFHERLTSRNLNLEEEREMSENDTDGEDSREIQNSSWHTTIPDVDPSHQSLCHLMPPTLPHERSGRETPVSVDSIPLEWDPTVDVGGSSMHENEEEGAYYNHLSDVEIAESPEAYVIMTTKTVQASSGKSDLETPSWHSPSKHLVAVKMEFKDDRKEKGLVIGTAGTGTILHESSRSHETISSLPKEIDSENSTGDQLEDQGLRGMESPETPSGVIERWEIIQAQSSSSELQHQQGGKRWQQISQDLDKITLWLDKTEAELEQVKKLKPSSTIRELEEKVQMLKEVQRTFDESKALVISANLSSKEFQAGDEDTESRDVLNKLRLVNVRWERVCRELDTWRESLQRDFLQCEEFQERSDKLLLWLTEVEERRLQYRLTDKGGHPHVLQKNLMQLKEQLEERQGEANALQDLCSDLLSSMSGAGYIEAEERTHVIGTKLRQLLTDVSQDLAATQNAQDTLAADEVDSMISPTIRQQMAMGASSKDLSRERTAEVNVQEAPRQRSLFYRVLRAAFPLQLLLLFLLFFACMIPMSEEDFSCAHANNFARSFYPMLRYTNGPPPT